MHGRRGPGCAKKKTCTVPVAQDACQKKSPNVNIFVVRKINFSHRAQNAKKKHARPRGPEVCEKKNMHCPSGPSCAKKKKTCTAPLDQAARNKKHARPRWLKVCEIKNMHTCSQNHQKRKINFSHIAGIPAGSPSWTGPCPSCSEG